MLTKQKRNKGKGKQRTLRSDVGGETGRERPQTPIQMVRGIGTDLRGDKPVRRTEPVRGTEPVRARVRIGPSTGEYIDTTEIKRTNYRRYTVLKNDKSYFIDEIANKIYENLPNVDNIITQKTNLSTLPYKTSYEYNDVLATSVEDGDDTKRKIVGGIRWSTYKHDAESKSVTIEYEDGYYVLSGPIDHGYLFVQKINEDERSKKTFNEIYDELFNQGNGEEIKLFEFFGTEAGKNISKELASELFKTKSGLITTAFEKPPENIDLKKVSKEAYKVTKKEFPKIKNLLEIYEPDVKITEEMDEAFKSAFESLEKIKPDLQKKIKEYNDQLAKLETPEDKIIFFSGSDLVLVISEHLLYDKLEVPTPSGEEQIDFMQMVDRQIKDLFLTPKSLSREIEQNLMTPTSDRYIILTQEEKATYKKMLNAISENSYENILKSLWQDYVPFFTKFLGNFLVEDNQKVVYIKRIIQNVEAVYNELTNTNINRLKKQLEQLLVR